MNSDLLKDARRLARIIGQRVTLCIPSTLAVGETFDLRVSVTGADAMPVERDTPTLRFEGSTGVQGLPPSFRLDPGQSAGCIAGLKATGPDVAVVRARVDEPGIPESLSLLSSNPAWVWDDPPYRLFWGDVHIHTRFSNCHGWRCLDPEWCYQYARDISFLDFAAPADHLRGLAADASRWPRLQELARLYNEPGRFVTFLAFESSHAQGQGGDNNAYFLDDDAPYFWLDREDMRGTNPKVHLRELWRQMDATGKPYFTIPHHTGRAGKYRTWNEDYHDPVREPLFEIYSSWGSSEMRWSRFPISGGNNDDVSYFTDALKAGARFGVMASSDDHATLPGSAHHFRVDPFRVPGANGHAFKGLTAVRCPALTRRALFDAMRIRSAYATTHARSLVDMRLGDASMGEAIPADPALKARREIRVRLTAHDVSSARVCLMRNGEPLATKSVRGDAVSNGIAEAAFEDAQPLDAIAVRDARYHPNPFAVYYARVEDANGNHQWTSPIWIDL